MKKVLFALSIGFISIAALNNCAYGHYSAALVAFNNGQHFKTSVRNAAEMESPALMGASVPDTINVNAKAIGDFQVRFEDADNADWFFDQNSLIFYYEKDGLGNRVFYDKKGRWQYSLLFYRDDKLPHDIRAIVRSKFFDMNITLVEELHTPDGMVYLVHLEDKSNIKILKVSKEGEMETFRDLTKE